MDEAKDLAGRLRAKAYRLRIRPAPNPEAVQLLTEAASEIERLRGALEKAHQNVVAFCAPWAVRYAQDHGFPRDHLHPAHYDILEKAGARMDDFTRAVLHLPDQQGDGG